jgi:hypothetical protein
MAAVFVQHIISQRKKFAGVQIMGFGLPAVPDNGVNPSPGGGQQRDHPVIIPVIDVPQHNGGILCLNHSILGVRDPLAGWRILKAMLSYGTVECKMTASQDEEGKVKSVEFRVKSC